ncbi:MAG: bifunctional riboflavin kinase/FAD synthetase [Saprospiraceae bacterium]
MNVYYDLEKLPEFTNSVVTIGSYDGVHQGHQSILRQLKKLAQDAKGESVVVTFHPHPRQVLQPNIQSLRLLSTIEEKIALFEANGVDHLVIVPFSKEFASQSADEYITKFLVRLFSPKYIVIGYDHRFGKGREGNIDYLKKHEAEYGFEVVEIKKQVVDKLGVSSTKVRDALGKGEVNLAHQLLGHPYTLTGTVIEGQKIGRSIGFPTANLQIQDKHKLIPDEGIYAVFATVQPVTLPGRQYTYKAMLYIGKRPTLKKFNNQTVEVNILDFDQDIYGKALTLTFVKQVRGARQFDSRAAWNASLEADRKTTVRLFQSLPEDWKKKALLKNNPSDLASVGIVILNYNGRKWLEQFLPSVLATSYSNTTIYVADNGSTDDSLSFLSKNYPTVQTIVMTENHGFAGGYNNALAQIENEDYFVLLNSDVEVTPQWIDPIIHLMEKDQQIAACQPKILSYKNKAMFEHAGAAGGWIDHLGYPFCRGRVFNVTETDEGQYDDQSEIFWASGAAMFIRSGLYKKLGGFDASFFAHMEEIDLCWRIKRAGYKIMAVPESVVYHVGGGTLDYHNPRKVFLNFRNGLTMLLKNESRSKLLWLLPLRLVLDGLAALLFLTEGKWKNIWAIVRAHWAFFANIPAIRKRAKEYDQQISSVRISEKENKTAHWGGAAIVSFYLKGLRTFQKIVNRQ